MLRDVLTEKIAAGLEGRLTNLADCNNQYIMSKKRPIPTMTDCSEGDCRERVDLKARSGRPG